MPEIFHLLDLAGREIKFGSIVAFPSQHGHSVTMKTGRVTKINLSKPDRPTVSVDYLDEPEFGWEYGRKYTTISKIENLVVIDVPG